MLADKLLDHLMTARWLDKLREDFHHRPLQHHTEGLLQSARGAASVVHVQHVDLHFHKPVYLWQHNVITPQLNPPPLAGSEGWSLHKSCRGDPMSPWPVLVTACVYARERMMLIVVIFDHQWWSCCILLLCVSLKMQLCSVLEVWILLHNMTPLLLITG